jgi:iron(III) transport system permease protein
VAVVELPRTDRTSSGRLSRLSGRVALLAFIGALAYLVCVPLVRLQAVALEHGAQAYRTTFTTPGIWKVVFETAELAIGSLVIALVLGTVLAWSATGLSSRLRFMRVLPILPMIVPGVAYVLGWMFLFSPRPGYFNALLRHLPWWSHQFAGPADIYTLKWILIINGLALASYVYLFVSAGIDQLNGELFEAAHVGGSNRMGVFFRVTLPLLRPALVYGGGVALLVGLGQFTAPLILGRNEGVSVLTTQMYFATQQVPADYATAAALGSPLLIFGIAVLLFQKLMLGDHTRFVTHGGKGFRSPAKTSRIGALTILLFSLVSTVLPIAALVIVSLSHFWTGEVHPSLFTLDNFRAIGSAPGVTDAIVNSLIVSVVAVLIALPIGYIAANVLLRRNENRFVRGVLDLIVAVPLSIPAVIFGVGFLLAYTHPPFILYGTKWVMILVYVTLMIPFSTRMQLSGMLALGNSYTEASRVSGAGPLRTHLTILLPLMRSTFGGAAGLMFVLLASEFAASLLVRSTRIQVMGTILYDNYNNGGYPLVACVALIMILVTSAGVLLAIVLGGSDLFKRL